MCLFSETIILFNHKAISKFGDQFSILFPEEIDNLADSVELSASFYGFDDIETLCLAAYQISKKHLFLNGNKRTAQYVLLNCLRQFGYSYTGRPKDLSDQIISITDSDPQRKREAVLQLAYFLRSRLQSN